MVGDPGGGLHLLGLVGEVVWELAFGGPPPSLDLSSPPGCWPAGHLLPPSGFPGCLSENNTVIVVTVTIRLLLWPPHLVWEPGDRGSRLLAGGHPSRAGGHWSQPLRPGGLEG